MRITITVILTALSTLCAAAAEDCPPLRLLTSVQLVPMNDGREWFVPVEIGGMQKLMLLDTGGARTLLGEAAASELKLPTYQAQERLYNVTGSYIDKHTRAELKIGALRGNIDFMVDTHFTWKNPDVIGLIGADILSRYDVSIDFGTGKMELLDSDHCEGKVVYWRPPALAVVPFKLINSATVVVPVQLDGQKVNAIIDTGAFNSTIHIDVAEKRFDVKPGDTDTPAIGGLNDRKDLTTYSHRFKQLAFEGVAVANPELMLIPDRLTKTIGSRVPTGSHLSEVREDVEPDILLGMNVLKHMHIYLAYKEKRLYITPATPPKDK